MMLYWEGYLQSIDANMDQDTCGFWIAGPRIMGLYALFPCSFTFGTHLAWQWFLNVTNSGTKFSHDKFSEILQPVIFPESENEKSMGPQFRHLF